MVEKELNYVLIADDDKDMCDLLAYLLSKAGYETQQVQDGDAVISSLKKREPSLLLLDNIMPGTTGMDILAYTSLYLPQLPVIMITGNGGIFGAVAAMKAGASDYLVKPFDNTRVLDLVNKFSNIRHQLMSEPKNTTSLRIATFMGDSEEIRAMTRSILVVAPTNLSVIIQGESGIGKELVAKNIHQASPRSTHAFTPVDCGSISDSLIENELFGHEKGAYTSADKAHVGKIEDSDGGTLFLDEISNMSLSAQAKLLRVIQERVIYRVGSTVAIPVNIRILVASNEDLLDAVIKGKFREDLFYRLNEFTIRIASLRYRPADILFLAKRFIVEASTEMGKSVPLLSNLASNELQQYAWPGNVRQLRSTMRRATLMAESQIDVSDLDFPTDDNNKQLALKQDGAQQITLNTPFDCIAYMATLAPENLSLKSMMIMFSEVVIKNSLKVTNNNKSETARRLSIDYKTLLLKIKNFTSEGIIMTEKDNKVTVNVEGVLRGLGDLVGKLGDLAETGEKMKRSGVFDVDTGSDENAKAVYGFSVKMGLNENEEPKVEPFGNVHRNEQTGVTSVQEVSEPLIDVIEEVDHVLVLAEMPGISDADVSIELNGDVLTINAASGSKKYHKEAVLPRSFDSQGMTSRCRNGILEVKLNDS